jgi:DNA-binding HxlR family transcriptional regulator
LIPGIAEASTRKVVISVMPMKPRISEKWKLPIIIALSEGPLRFKELQKALEDITPVTVEYEFTDYSRSLRNILEGMREWGVQHKKRIKESARKAREAKGLTRQGA